MNDSAPNDPRPAGENTPNSGDGPGQVESCIGDNVVTIIVRDGGDNTIGPAPDYVRKHLEEYRRRMQPPPPPPES
jgi:hypothetical protein